MLTNKKRWRKQIQFLLLASAVVWIAGCMPSGPRSLLRGKRLIEQGKYADAIEELKTATSLLSMNAQAWNYLGLAYHHAGQTKEAIDAYNRAHRANPDLIVVHYNLGCLLLEMNRPDTLDAARNEFTAFTLHQRNSVDGLLKLGTAQLRLSDLNSAEASFKQVLQIHPQDPEALNDLGVIQLQRRHQHDAGTYFNAALQKDPNYAPAQLNLAILQLHMNSRTLALQQFQQYLATNPHAANFDAVNAIAQQLDAELNPPAHPVITNAAVAVNPPTNVVHASTDTVTVLPPKPPEQVRVAQNPVPTPRPTVTQPAVVQPKPVSDPVSQPIAELPPEPPPKRGFLSRLFHHGDKTPPPATDDLLSPVPSVETISNAPTVVSKDSGAVSISTPPPVRVVTIPRYPYWPPGRPATGNRADAENMVARGVAAERDGLLKDAVQYYRAAAAADPSFFDAQTDLGAAAANAGDLGQALRAYEMAVNLKPDSFSTRFNFGLLLKRANYIQDAAEELEKLLASNTSSETPAHLAVVHLTLGNLYAEQFHQPAPARKHYLKVLELDPENSQATSIRFWLQNNP